jgi:16S rRNA (guanine966-N2)-methyltransferase
VGRGLRIVSGSLKGRRLATPPGLNTRPTADRVREAVFSILHGRVGGAHVLDLFSGSGAMAMEAISRGADAALALDNDPKAIDAITANIDHCGVGDRMRAHRWDIRAGLGIAAGPSVPYTLVFMDPPYGTDLADIALAHLQAARCTAPGTPIVIEHDQRSIPHAISGFCGLDDQRRYGKTLVSIFTTMV